ncbi:MAG: hypothetical protein MHM6MM_000441 [Cercozoa sp. M6MM]
MAESIKQKLQTVSDGGQSVYSHLVSLVAALNKQVEPVSLQDFENFSVAVKQRDEKLLSSAFDELPEAPMDNAFALKQISAEQALFRQEVVDATEEEDNLEKEDAESEITSNIADCLEEHSLLRWAGIQMSERESFAAYLSLERLARDTDNLAEVRLFGRVQGLRSDYWVAQAKLTEYPEADELLSCKAEASGVGANEDVFFVTSNLRGDAWTRLPDVSPEQIKLARKIRVRFTGDLEAELGSYPRFPWSEKVYLRAQLARLSASTTVAPAGQFEVTQDEEAESENLQPTENWEFPLAAELCSPDKWVHKTRNMLLQGRLVKYEKPEAEEEEDGDKTDEQEHEPTEEELEEPKPLLTNLEEDTFDGLSSVWTFDAQPRFKNRPLPNSVAILRSNTWVGVTVVAKAGRVVHFYDGNGLKWSAREQYPHPEYTMQQCFNDAVEEEVEPEVRQDNDEDKAEAVATEPQLIRKSLFLEQLDPRPPTPEPEPEPEENENGENSEEMNDDD